VSFFTLLFPSQLPPPLRPFTHFQRVGRSALQQPFLRFVNRASTSRLDDFLSPGDVSFGFQDLFFRLQGGPFFFFIAFFFNALNHSTLVGHLFS